jgi:hypothetical protein
MIVLPKMAAALAAAFFDANNHENEASSQIITAYYRNHFA